MRRWARLQDSYMEEYRARGLSPETVACTESRLDRWGRWLKKRRPRVVIEQIGVEAITHYIATCTSFRSKATVYGTLSTMRGFGDYLVGQGLWKINPLCWMKGPKVTPHSRLPKRIDRAHMEALFRILAVDIRSRRFGYAVFETPAQLLDSGITRFASAETGAVRFAGLCKVFRPSLIVLRKESVVAVAAIPTRMPFVEGYEVKLCGDLYQPSLLRSGQSRAGSISTDRLASMPLHRSLPIGFRNFRGGCHLAGKHGNPSPGAFSLRCSSPRCCLCSHDR